ncbi:MAG: YkgJ family cysteine cluster protein [Proteobacteria bacterium]|nr:YkgJ family cysteine cluster protein [Pseudomonadota bacterium]
MSRMSLNPCLSCGACCAYYRVSFYWAEADDAPFGTVPSEKTEPHGPFRRAMIGTNKKMPRCLCLQGEIGINVFCDIYDQRSSVCKNFDASWVKDVWNERCDMARMAWGLDPLEPDIFNDPGKFPRAA